MLLTFRLGLGDFENGEERKWSENIVYSRGFLCIFALLTYVIRLKCKISMSYRCARFALLIREKCTHEKTASLSQRDGLNNFNI